MVTHGGIQSALARPEPTEFAAYYATYVNAVPDGELLAMLRDQLAATEALLRDIGEARGNHRYAPGKWSVKEVIGHLADAERVFAYRALRFARGDRTPLPGYEQDDYVRTANFDARHLAEIAAEFRSVRSASITLFTGLTPEALVRRGTANNVEFTARALGWIIAGHELHHRRLLKDRYL
jgi:hypothetical protein